MWHSRNQPGTGLWNTSPGRMLTRPSVNSRDHSARSAANDSSASHGRRSVQIEKPASAGANASPAACSLSVAAAYESASRCRLVRRNVATQASSVSRSSSHHWVSVETGAK